MPVLGALGHLHPFPRLYEPRRLDAPASQAPRIHAFATAAWRGCVAFALASPYDARGHEVFKPDQLVISQCGHPSGVHNVACGGWYRFLACSHADQRRAQDANAAAPAFPPAGPTVAARNGLQPFQRRCGEASQVTPADGILRGCRNRKAHRLN